MDNTLDRRIVITGMGVVSPVGIGKADFWSALTAGRSGVDRITLFDTPGYPVTIAGEVKGFDLSDRIESKELRHMDRFVQFALAHALTGQKLGPLAP